MADVTAGTGGTLECPVGEGGRPSHPTLSVPVDVVRPLAEGKGNSVRIICGLCGQRWNSAFESSSQSVSATSWHL